MNLSIAGTLAVLAFVLPGCGSRIAAPTAYKTWNATDGSFSIQYPEGWKAQGGEIADHQWAEFSKGSAKIRIDLSTQTSAYGDIMRSFGTAAGLNNPFSAVPAELQEKLEPVAAAHNYYQENWPVELPNYKEQTAVPFRSGLGDCRKSEFAARAGISGKVRGYRATGLTANKGVHVLCQCSEANWPTLQPVYDKVLESLALGSP